MDDLNKLKASSSVVIAAAPDVMYDMVSDIARMGEWSPVCKTCWWDEVGGPNAGAWFTAKNVLPDREFENRSQVLVANRPGEFAWMVGGIEEGYARWGYTFTAVEGGTLVEESWAITRLVDRVKDMTEERAAGLLVRARAGMEATLENLTRVAEATAVVI